MKLDLLKTKDFVEKLVKEAGKFLLENQNKVQIKKYKDRQDICTNIDLAVEKMVIEALEKKYPTHNILSEEKGLIDKKGEFTWVIDPLDGTKEYIRGFPIFNVNISLEANRKTLLGTVFLPKTNDIFSAVGRLGAFKNGCKTAVSQEAKLENSFIYTHLPDYKMPEKFFKKTWIKLGAILRLCYRLRSFQADILSLCWLANGGLEGFILLPPTSARWWDLATGILMVEEAGGKVTDQKGKPLRLKDGKVESIVASNGRIHGQILKILNN